MFKEKDMKFRFFALPFLTFVLVLGCGKSDTPQGEKAEKKTTQVAETKDHDHSGWWCDEHGMPEEICAQCNRKLAAEFKKKGDRCKDHDRPDSQCFICHPELKEKFAAQYRAKYGKEPPPMEDEEKSKKQEQKR
jgi:hypothetical protein